MQDFFTDLGTIILDSFAVKGGAISTGKVSKFLEVAMDTYGVVDDAIDYFAVVSDYSKYDYFLSVVEKNADSAVKLIEVIPPNNLLSFFTLKSE